MYLYHYIIHILFFLNVTYPCQTEQIGLSCNAYDFYAEKAKLESQFPFLNLSKPLSQWCLRLEHDKFHVPLFLFSIR
jgi:hypothetical protein